MFFSSFHRVDLLIISLTDKPTCCSLLRAHRRAIMLLPAFLLFTLSHFLAPLLLCYLPQVSAQKPGSRVSAYIPVCVSDGLDTFAVSPAPEINPVPKGNGGSKGWLGRGNVAPDSSDYTNLIFKNKSFNGASSLF